jgi:hypothetical protein
MNRAGSSALNFAELPPRGVTIVPGTEAIYNRAEALCAGRPISFEFWDKDGGMRFYQDRVRIWLPENGPNVGATVAHELAHIIVAKERNAPRLHPDRPGQPERRILSDLISIPDHQLVHELMGDYGVLPADDARSYSEWFLQGVAKAPMLPGDQNVHLAVGYAMMLTVFRYDALIPAIASAMRSKSPRMHRLGEQLSDYVTRDRNTTLYQDAFALMEIARIAPQLRACVMSVEEFRRQFGWS